MDSTHSACPPNQSGLTRHWSVLVGITIAPCYPLFVPLAHGFQPPHLTVIALSLTPLIPHALQTNQVWHVVGLSWLESLLLPATPSLDVIFLLYHLVYQENCNRLSGVVIGWTDISSGTSHCWDHVLACAVLIDWCLRCCVWWSFLVHPWCYVWYDGTIWLGSSYPHCRFLIDGLMAHY